MNEYDEATEAANKSEWLKAITTFAAVGITLDIVAFWVVLILCLFDRAPWVALGWVLLIAVGIIAFAFVGSIALGLAHGLTRDE
jgi:uncharacterized membrane protein YcjF (UPF0283 family)